MAAISATDRGALTRCLIACRAESPVRAKQIFDMLSTRPWERVAKFACYSAQIHSLGLQPWQNPPMYARLPDLKKPFDDPRGERAAAEILKKLLAHRLSMYEPDPLQAIERAEHKTT
ncbi:hypothetical protein ACVW1A_005280 [Bradyrhizobium sp. LB1.3]